MQKGVCRTSRTHDLRAITKQLGVNVHGCIHEGDVGVDWRRWGRRGRAREGKGGEGSCSDSGTSTGSSAGLLQTQETACVLLRAPTSDVLKEGTDSSSSSFTNSLGGTSKSHPNPDPDLPPPSRIPSPLQHLERTPVRAGQGP